jgi:hypothetical protein
VAGQTNRDFDAEVLGRMAEGESLRSICAELKDFGCPSASRFVHRVLDGEQPLTQHYARARELQAEAWADIIREHSAKCRPGEITTTRADGGVEVRTTDCVDRSRLEVDSMKWLLAKLHPKRYGDKLAVGGAEDLGPVQLSWKSRSTTPPETKP